MSFTEEEIDNLSVRDAVAELIDSSRNERLGLPAGIRVPLLVSSAALVGGLSGMVFGYREAGLRFLASNSHRLPTNRNGWFMYHKRKGYYCFAQSFVLGAKTAGKIGLFTAVMFGTEALLDEVRQLKDFGNTMAATTLTGFFYAWALGMKPVQAKNYIRKGGKYGLLLGVAQDALIFSRGGYVWYINGVLGLEPKKLHERID
ncbi:hypothetical protein KL933_003693 [Ogataea haglerorum]|uniref:Uncharacterized protein n=1 Tax=Ogataea haglerorum TaxID=1937702 RepID=A0AAN6D582_9ASCO|nr:uncharacterized protein KL911_003944 [Ogataea haglerorum]KAG7694486.1 hypothetical protein KL915_003453 [Ogataea haglerorum]KAG7695314.1 hypothetical protein KL951_003756 [Ogataea haglerorum]KAG7705178.1 hypothetical protein KL914_003864 [Ogataea haglerorum]KAG7705435.1 hypothetical protein KL950_003871 [Ogataea haglerorum]KAG7716696.1 hypothetical protein KL913_003212 [Ogataea haglerorum]